MQQLRLTSVGDAGCSTCLKIRDFFSNHGEDRGIGSFENPMLVRCATPIEFHHTLLASFQNLSQREELHGLCLKASSGV